MARAKTKATRAKTTRPAAPAAAAAAAGAPAAKARAKAKAKAKPEAALPAVAKRWLGCFTVTDDEGVESSFQMLAQAGTVAKAVQRFDLRLRELYRTTSLFNDGGDVFLDYVIDISGDFTTPVLVNYVAQGSVSEGPVIFCDLPEQPEADIDTYGPPEDVEEEEPLLTFKPRKTVARKGSGGARRKPAVH